VLIQSFTWIHMCVPILGCLFFRCFQYRRSELIMHSFLFDLHVHMQNIRDNLVQSVVHQPIAPRVEQTMHYRSPECRDPQMQIPEHASCSFSNYSVQPVNNGQHTNGATLHDKAYNLRPPHPAPSSQFSYFHGDQHVRPQRDAPPPSYSNRFHFVQNVERENSGNNHERIKPPPYERHEHWRFPAPPFSGKVLKCSY
jgi:hypothetical protein